MADNDHIRALLGGRVTWEEWRQRHPETKPDLKGLVASGKNFSRLDLSGSDLREAKLEGCNLQHANLTQANLSGSQLQDLKGAHGSFREAELIRVNAYNSDFSDCDFHRAVLHDAMVSDSRFARANLWGASLVGADLTGCDFDDANLDGASMLRTRLEGAILTNTSLKGTYFSEAVFGKTVISATSLAAAHELDSVVHRSRSYIDFHTLLASGDLPLSFIRGVGLPDVLIEYLPSLRNQPFQFYSCFISYSSRDKLFAEQLHSDLQGKGVRCWFAPEDLKIGDKFRDRIDESIRVYDRLLLILSKDSIGSEWVETESELALERERSSGQTVLFPIRLDAAALETSKPWARHIRVQRHIGDFSDWQDRRAYTVALTRLLRDLRDSGITSPGSVSSPAPASGDFDDDIPF
ncbi:MAG: toll/interleukin-1 receptor domain-containing protein [Pseudomonadota bacterium]